MNLKLGRLPARHDKRDLKLSTYLKATGLPPIPNAADWGGKVASYGMLANDSVGDCTCAGAGHAEQVWTANAGIETTVTDQDALTAYSAITGYDPSQTDASGNNPTDQGANMTDVLNYWRQTGIAGEQIASYVSVDWTNPAEVSTALYLFGVLYIGVNLPQSAMDAFGAGQPWTNTTDTNIVGGHCVILVGYDLGAQTAKLVTWGREITASLAWVKQYCEEAYAIASEFWEEAAGQSPSGINWQQLQVDLQAVSATPSNSTPPQSKPWRPGL